MRKNLPGSIQTEMKFSKPILPLLFQWSALLFLGLCLTGASDVKPGELVVQEAAVYRAEGRRLQEKGRPKEALTVYQKAVAVDPEYTDAYNDMGVMFETLGQNLRAEEAYKSALRLEPNFAAARSNLALLYERMGKVKEATEHWAARARIGLPGDSWAVKAREKLIQYHVPVPENLADLEKKKKAQVSLTYQMGLDHMEAKEWDLAHQEFGQVLAWDPAHSKAAERIRSVRAKQKEVAQREEELARRRAREIEAALPVAVERAEKEKGKTGREKAEASALKKAAPPPWVAPPKEVKPPSAQMEKPEPVVRPVVVSEAKTFAQSLAKEKAKTRRTSVDEIYQRGVAAMRQMDFSEAVLRFEQALSLDPAHSDAKLALKRAQTALSKAAQTNP